MTTRVAMWAGPRNLSTALMRSVENRADCSVVDEPYGGPVVDAADVLRAPRGTLSLLCAALGIGFDEAMLAWPAGPRATDGVWAPYWYAGVEASTGFATDSPGSGDALPDHLVPL